MKDYLKFTLLLTFAVLSFTACEKDDPEIPNEEELITTLKYTLTPADGGTAVEMSFQDLDGDGGEEPAITNGVLASNTTYNGRLELLNEQTAPAESINTEILEEAVDHQFFFSPTLPGDSVKIEYDDQDTNGNPLGLNTTLTTTITGAGTLTIILRHEPNKTAEGVATGDISNAGGESDIEVTFAIEVQ